MTRLRILLSVTAATAPLVLALASCTTDFTVVDQVETARDLDILYVFDNSAGRGAYDQMASQLGVLTARLAEVDGALPSLHVGVVTTDLGTRGRLDAQPGPAVGRCAGDGDAGRLVTFDAGFTFGGFLEDLRGPGGTRIRNFDGTLVRALDRLTNPPIEASGTGCGFAQPLEAMRRALDPDTNPGFIRPGAMLSIVLLTNQDDCSLARGAMLDPANATLGPLFPFRCTEQGVICDPDDPRRPGVHANCRPRDASPFLVDVSEYRTFLAGYKPDPHDVTLVAVAGPRTPFEVRDIGLPVLSPSCQGAGGSATPAVRIGAVVDSVGGTLVNACTQDAAYPQIAAPIVERQRGCFPDVRQTDGEGCTVAEVAGGATTSLARCADGNAAPCWYAYADAAICSGKDHVRFAVNRGGAAPPEGARLQVRCPP